MKRLLSILLTLTMCLSLMTFTAVAAANISVNKTTLGYGDKIKVTVTGLTDESDPYIAIYKKGTAANQYGKWCRVNKNTSEYELDIEVEAGEYEVRLYSKTYAIDADFITSVPITVTAGTLPTDTLEGANVNAVGNYNWSGKWEDSNYGEIIIIQNGSEVTGTYPHDQGKITATAQGNMLYGQWAESPTYTPPNDGGDFEFVMSEDGMSFIGHSRYGSNAAWRQWNGKRILETSDWATGEITSAYQMGLVPDVLVGVDLSQDITRAEFAAVAVKAYEALSGTPAIPAVNNPFTDTSDVEVLKAYNIGAVNGTSATTFDPNALLNREQAAAMLTRVFKKVSLAGWTLATDSQFTLPYEKPALFADDADISDWAKDSVYFMVANGIINGVGNNKFAPKNVTSADEANGYANATREQALIIAVRMVENLKK